MGTWDRLDGLRSVSGRPCSQTRLESIITLKEDERGGGGEKKKERKKEQEEEEEVETKMLLRRRSERARGARTLPHWLARSLSVCLFFPLSSSCSSGGWGKHKPTPAPRRIPHAHGSVFPRYSGSR